MSNSFTKITLLYFLTLSIILAMAYYFVRDNVLKTIAIESETKLHTCEQLLTEISHEIASDMIYLNKEIEQELQLHRNYTEAASTMYLFASSKTYYDQLRIIDTSGQEKVRIYTKNGITEIAGADSLQNKANRYYFKEANHLKKGEFMYSNFDLNIENGKIELPYKPVIRIMTGLFDKQNQKAGILIANYSGHHAFEKIKRMDTEKTTLLLINKDGYYLKGISPEKEWGFMFDDKKEVTLFADFPDESDSIFQNNNGILHSKNGIFHYTSSYTNKNNLFVHYTEHTAEKQPSKWRIIAYTPQANITNMIIKDYMPWLIFGILSLIPIGIINWFIAKNINLANKNQITQEYLEKEKKQKAEIEEKNKQVQSILEKTVELYDQLAFKNTELEDVNATKNKFFSIIAHDLRSPFNTLMGFSNLLARNAKTYTRERIEESALRLYDISEKTYELLENLLEWSRLQSGALQPIPNYIVINELLDEVIKQTQNTAEQKQIKIAIQANTENCGIMADKAMLTTVLRNLVTNSIKFSHPETGKIILSTHLKNDRIEIQVQDNGTGIEEKNLATIFDKTNKLSQAGTNNEKGSGLGLILCKEFVEANEGTIRVESIYGEGSKFTICFPKELQQGKDRVLSSEY